MPRNITEYMTSNKNMINKCKQAEEEWINEKWAEAEKLHNTEIAAIHKKIKEIVGDKMWSSAGYIQSKEETIIMEMWKVLKR